VRIETESLTTLLLGGIGFVNPPGAGEDQPAATDGQRFTLFADREAALSPSSGPRQRWVLEFSGSVRGLLPGAPVEFRGIRVGEVVDVRLEVGDEGSDTRIPVEIAVEPARLGVPAEDHGDPAHRAFWDRLVADGLRAQLKSGNLLTGALFVDLDFYPDEAPRTVAWHSGPPELPTVPTALDELRSVLSRLSRLPLDQMGSDLSASLAALHETMAATNTLLRRLDRETATELTQTLAQTRDTLEGVEKLVSPNSPLQAEAYRALREFAAAARSFRLMADYLERHPEALIRGKGEVNP
jgi:paraquat-inducible protein B